MARLRISIIVLSCIVVSSALAMSDILPYATIEKLVDKADLIVRGSQESDHNIRVQKIYKGRVKTPIIAVNGLDSYQTTLSRMVRPSDADLPSDIGRNDVVVFLVTRKDGTFSPVASGAGIKRIYEGRVFAYHQSMGSRYALSPSLETDTDCSVIQNWQYREPLTAELLEAYITVAMRRSRHFDGTVSLQEIDRRALGLASYITTSYGHSSYYARKALKALEDIGAPSLPSFLTVLQADICNPSRNEVINSLGRIGNPEAVPVLLQELMGSRYQCRRSAIYALGELRSAEALEPLCAILSQPENNDLAFEAIHALGRIGDLRAFETIIPYLWSEDDRIRFETIAALSLLKDQRAFDPLIKALGEPSRKGDADFRTRALEVLNHIDRARGIPIFIEHLRSAESGVARAAHLCLGHSNLEDYDEARAWYDRQPKDENGVIILQN